MRPTLRRPVTIPFAVVLALAGLSPATLAQDTPATAPPSLEPGVAAAIDDLVADVPDLRRLEALAPVPYRAIDLPTFRVELEALFDEEYPPGLVAAETAALTRLGLLPAGTDLRTTILDLLGDQALAYYDTRTKTVTFVGDLTEVGPAEQIIVVHEYGHALQDQHWDLEGTATQDPGQSDRILAETALTEGEATLLMFEWAADNLGPAELMRVSDKALSRSDEKLLARTPPIIRRQLVEFPYLDGYAFVNAVRARGEAWEAVDQAWAARPVSTEQILHPERYPDDVPIVVALPDIATRLGEGWTASYEQTMGEMQMGVWVADGKEAPRLFGLPGRQPNAEAVEGWGGDRLVSLDGPDGAWAIVWQTAWDSQADADEFRSAAKATMKDLPGAHTVIATDITGGAAPSVLVLLADSEATLQQVRAATGAG